MTRLSAYVAVLVISLLCEEPALAREVPCVPIMTNGETDFVYYGHVPPFYEGVCYTFGLKKGQHVRMSVTQTEDMQLDVEVREPGTTEYHAVPALEVFTNIKPEGRLMKASTDTIGKEFQVFVASGKLKPDTSKEITFQINLE